MKTIEYLTAMVLAKRSLHQPLGEEAVLWADLLLAQGFEYEAVKELARHSPSDTEAQIESHVDVVLSILGIALVNEKAAHTILLWAWIQKLLKDGLPAGRFLETVHELCVDCEHEPVYMQFYLLQCAKKDLDKGVSAIVFHDRELTEMNFEEVLHWEIDLFLEQCEEDVLHWIKIRKR